ncbi:MAG: alpha/beta fold hydrolase [Bacteroidetes bacterium]|nr:alpha/beta fold hydrolase [Bacteroidota bacterium]
MWLKPSARKSAQCLWVFSALLLIWSAKPILAQGLDPLSVASPHVLYQRSFGNPTQPAVIYLHGGPGYNCSVFEATAAQALADEGFFVLVYDRRGEGRSGTEAAYTFEETLVDLNLLLEEHNITQATLLGHSFGGVVGLLFADRHPEKVSALVLVGAPIALQETFRTIIKNVRTRYEAKADSVNLAYIRQLEQMDTTSLAYSSYCFLHAMQAGLYSVAEPTEEAKILYETLANDSILFPHARAMGYAAPQGFWKNETYTTLNLWPLLGSRLADGLRVYGIYGKEDGLYSRAQIRRLEQHLGETNLVNLDHCSHNPFVDQQPVFLALMRGWLAQ